MGNLSWKHRRNKGSEICWFFWSNSCINESKNTWQLSNRTQVGSISFSEQIFLTTRPSYPGLLQVGIQYNICTWDHLGLSKRWFDVWSTNYSISHLISGYIWVVVSNMFYFPYFSIIYGIIMRIHQDIHHSHSFSLSVVEWSKMPPGAPGNDHGVPTASGSCGHGRLTSAPGRKGRDNSQSNLVIDPGKPAAEVSQT